VIKNRSSLLAVTVMNSCSVTCREILLIALVDTYCVWPSSPRTVYSSSSLVPNIVL